MDIRFDEAQQAIRFRPNEESYGEFLALVFDIFAAKSIEIELADDLVDKWARAENTILIDEVNRRRRRV